MNTKCRIPNDSLTASLSSNLSKTKIKSKPSTDKIFDLEERTAKFGENTIVFINTLLKSETNQILIKQVVRSATSIGANYMEADAAESRKDFEHKIALCKKETKETKHWLRMIAKTNSDKTQQCRKLWQEAQELTLIFSAIIKSSKTKRIKK